MKIRVSYLGGNGGIGMHAVTGCEIGTVGSYRKASWNAAQENTRGGCYTIASGLI